MFLWLSSWLVSGALYLFHLMPFTGALAGFFVFSWNRKISDGEHGTRSLIFGWLALPFVVMAALLVATPTLSLMSLAGHTVILPGWADIGIFVGTAAVSVLGAVMLLRHGVQVHQKAARKLTKNADLERNKKTDIRELHNFLPMDEEGNSLTPRFDALARVDFKKGIFLGENENGRRVYLKHSDWKVSHMTLSGRTRSGKGVAAQILGAQSIMMKEFFVVLDPKCDNWMPHIYKKVCDDAGQPYHFLDLRQSAPPQINIFDDCTAEEIENMLIGAFGLTERGDNAEIYRQANRKAARQTAKYVSEHPGVTPREIYAQFGDEWRENMATGFAEAMEDVAELPAMNRADGNGISLKKMAEETGGCLYTVGDMQNTRILRMQRIILLRLMLLAKNRDQMQEQRIIRVLPDEFVVHISRPFMVGLGAAAGWRLLLILAFQSFEDLKNAPADLNPDAVRGSVMENCALQLSYRIKDDKTAELLAASTGTILVDDESRTVDRNLALSETVDSRRSIRQAERYFIDENMIKGLPVPNPDEGTIGCGVLIGASKLAQFCFTSPIMVERSKAAISPTVLPQEVGYSAKSVAEEALDIPDLPEAPAEADASSSSPFPSSARADLGESASAGASPFPSSADADLGETASPFPAIADSPAADPHLAFDDAAGILDIPDLQD